MPFFINSNILTCTEAHQSRVETFFCQVDMLQEMVSDSRGLNLVLEMFGDVCDMSA